MLTNTGAGVPGRWQCEPDISGGALGAKLHGRDSRAQKHTQTHTYTHKGIHTNSIACLTSVESLTELG